MVGSKPNHSISDSAKVINEVQRATKRALRATSSSLPRMSRMNSAPTSGRNVVTVRMGNPAMSPYPACSNKNHDTRKTTPISIAKA